MQDFPYNHTKKSKPKDNPPKKAIDRLDSAILHSLPVGVIAFDSNLKIIKTNPLAQSLIELNDTTRSANTPHARGNAGHPIPLTYSCIFGKGQGKRNGSSNGVINCTGCGID